MTSLPQKGIKVDTAEELCTLTSDKALRSSLKANVDDSSGQKYPFLHWRLFLHHQRQKQNGRRSRAVNILHTNNRLEMV